MIASQEIFYIGFTIIFIVLTIFMFIFVKNFKKFINRSEEMATYYIRNNQIEEFDRGKPVQALNILPGVYDGDFHKRIIPKREIIVIKMNNNKANGPQQIISIKKI